MEITPLKKDDYTRVRALELFCMREYLEATTGKKWESLSKELIDQLGASSKGSFEHYLKERLSFVALEDDQVVGFIFAKMIEHFYNIPKVVWVENMGVHPHYRRQGIGYRLLERLIIEGKRRGARAIHSSIMPNNAPSIMLHKKIGFFIDARKIAFLDLESVETVSD